jgi:hypothetical protein
VITDPVTYSLDDERMSVDGVDAVIDCVEIDEALTNERRRECDRSWSRVRPPRASASTSARRTRRAWQPRGGAGGIVEPEVPPAAQRLRDDPARAGAGRIAECWVPGSAPSQARPRDGSYWTANVPVVS